MPTLSLEERLKYEEVWSIDQYRVISPGENAVDDFCTVISKPTDIIDLGCGTGRASLELQSLGHSVHMVDIAGNCLDEAVKEAVDEGLLTFKQQCLWSKQLPKATWGFCCDVMEHIPEDRVDNVLANIMQSVDACYFQIHMGRDVFGPKYMDTALHLTVKEQDWWRLKVEEYFEIDKMSISGSRNHIITIIARSRI